VTPYGVKSTDHVRNEFAAGHARKQSFTLSTWRKDGTKDDLCPGLF
jgi:hypothetical protein